jgi:hypothetical protein
MTLIVPSGLSAVVSHLRRGDVRRGVHPCPMDRVPSIAGELGEEDALGAAVALPEWVQGVHIGQQRGEAVNEGRSLETPEMTSPGELAEHVLGKEPRCCGRQNRSPLPIETPAQLAGPVVEVTEDPTRPGQARRHRWYRAGCTGPRFRNRCRGPRSPVVTRQGALAGLTSAHPAFGDGLEHLQPLRTRLQTLGSHRRQSLRDRLPPLGRRQQQPVMRH